MDVDVDGEVDVEVEVVDMDGGVSFCHLRVSELIGLRSFFLGDGVPSPPRSSLAPPPPISPPATHVGAVRGAVTEHEFCTPHPYVAAPRR
jgi:hypothetical protein